jgi:hypothetical protein
MKIKYVLLSTVLALFLTLPIFGQHKHDDKTKTDMKKHHMSKMMGKPAVDATVEGLHMKVWLMTQKQHKKMMEKMKHDGMGMKDAGMAMNEEMKEMKHDSMKIDKATREAMMAGTHHIMLVVTDSASGKEVTDASAKVLILFPSKKSMSTDLRPVMNHFADGLTLNEKGEYQFTVIVKADGVPKATKFQYKVK